MQITYSTDRAFAASSQTLISNTFILNYMSDAPQNFIRVYLYALMQNQNSAFAQDDISLALSLPDSEIISAFDYWQKKGLINVIITEPMHIEFVKPKQISASSVGKYANLLKSIREILGARVLTDRDIKNIYDWIEIFGIEEEAIKILFIYCIAEKGPKVSTVYMDSVVKTWVGMNIHTAEQATEYTTLRSLYSKGAGEIVRRFGLKRNPTDDEVELYRTWIEDYKFTHETILDACRHTTSATNPSFSYLDKIICEYKEKGAVDSDSLASFQKEAAILEDFCKELFVTAGLSKKPSYSERDKINMWLTDYHMSKDMLKLLANAAKNNHFPFDFMCKKVAAWNDSNIRNIEDAKADLNAPQKSKYVTPKKSFAQHTYTDADRRKLIITADDYDDDDEE